MGLASSVLVVCFVKGHVQSGHPGDSGFFPRLWLPRVWVLPLGFLPGAGGSL